MAATKPSKSAASATAAASVSRQPFRRMVGRAVGLRCPWCGSRRTFVRKWLGRHDRCRSCGIEWRREDGFELGAITVNIIATFVVITALMTAAFIATSPDIPVLPLVLTLGVVAVLLPIAIYPFGNLLWLAVDLAAHPPEAPELAAAAAAVAAGAAPGALGAPGAAPAHDLSEDA